MVIPTNKVKFGISKATDLNVGPRWSKVDLISIKPNGPQFHLSLWIWKWHVRLLLLDISLLKDRPKPPGRVINPRFRSQRRATETNHKVLPTSLTPVALTSKYTVLSTLKHSRHEWLNQHLWQRNTTQGCVVRSYSFGFLSISIDVVAWSKVDTITLVPQLSVDVSAPHAVETRMRSACTRRPLNKQITGMGVGAEVRAYTCTNRELGSLRLFWDRDLRFALYCVA